MTVEPHPLGVRDLFSVLIIRHIFPQLPRKEDNSLGCFSTMTQPRHPPIHLLLCHLIMTYLRNSKVAHGIAV